MLKIMRLNLHWKKEDKYCTLNIDLDTYKSVIEYIDENKMLYYTIYSYTFI